MKKVIAILTVCSFILLSGCSAKPTETDAQGTTTAPQQTTAQPTTSLSDNSQWIAYFGSLAGVGTNTDFDETCREISKVAKDNIIDRAFLKELDDDLKSGDWSRLSRRMIVGKYIEIWKAEWEASDKRIQQLIKDETINKELQLDDENKIDYDKIKKAYEDNKKITGEYINKQSEIYNTIWMENLSSGNLDNVEIMVLNLYRKATLNSFQIECCLRGDFEFVYKPAE